MTQDNSRFRAQYPLAAAILALGLIFAAATFGARIKDIRRPGLITVKGLAEENFRADSASWRIGVAANYAGYGAALAGVESELPAVRQFLENQGFDSEEMHTTLPEIKQAWRDVYENDRYRREKNGFDGEQFIVVQSRSLDKIQAAVQAARKLKAGNEKVVFANPEYYLGDLESVKRSMIARATEDAQARAQEFAKTGNAELGSLYSASQGSFNIYADTPGTENEADYGGVYDKSTIGKKVRLVVTAQYILQ